MGRNKAVEDKGSNFVELLESIGYGALLQKLDQNLAEISGAVEETGKSGKIALTITVKKAGELARVSGDVKVTKPQHGTPEGIFFFGPDGRLTQEDARQLKLKEVTHDPTPIRTL
jgi:DUF4097 and DUF4098 domain-containing protein YvlB